MPIKYFKRTAISMAIAVAGTSLPVLAQDDNVLEEVIVTARLIDESIQEVPISVAAFSEQMLENRGLEDLTEIARATPNFSFENYNGGFGVPVIRAQSSNRLSNPVQNVATFYNGVYLQRGYMIDASLLNVGQVEILRGPQAAAFGRNAFAGAVNFKSKNIGEDPSVGITAAFGEDEYQRIDVTAAVPFSDAFGLIVGYSGGEYDGAYTNNHALADLGGPGVRTKGNLGGYDYDAYNIGFSLTPTENFSLKANYLKSERDVENVAQYTIGGGPLTASNTLNCSVAGVPVPGLSLTCGSLPTTVPLAPGETRKPGLVVDPRAGLELESEILSVEAKIDFTDALALNITYGRTEGSLDGANAASRDAEIGYDGFFATILGSTGLNFIDTSGNGNIEADSLEARLTWDDGGALTGYAGAFVSDSDDVTDYNLIAVPAQTVGPLAAGFPLSGPGFNADAVNQRDISSAFFLVNYRAENWAASAEGRYTKEEITDTNNLSATSATEDYSYFTPRLTATYFLSENNNLYASFAKGVKAGGFNTGGSDRTTFLNGQEVFDEETNNTFEIGSRNEMAGGALTLNATVFYIDSKDLQVNEPNAVSAFAPSVIGNRAEATTYGLELEAFYDATDSLSFYGGLGYAKAEYGDNVIDLSGAERCDGIVCSALGEIGGNRLERTPELTVNVGFDWGTSVTDQLDFFLRGDISYQDEQFLQSSNVTTIDSRTIANASLGFNYQSFEVKLAVDNLFDEEYVGSAFDLNFLKTTTVNLGQPRRGVLSVSYKY